MSITPRSSYRDRSDGVFDFLSRIEQAARQFNGEIHNDGIGVPTLGYGYALVVKDARDIWVVKGTLNADLQPLGTVFSKPQSDTLNAIVANLNSNNAQTASALNGPLIASLATGIAAIDESQGRQLFNIEESRAFTNLLTVAEIMQ